MARLGAVRIREVLAEHAQGMPPLVTVESGRSVGEAIDIMQRYGISQVPVTDGSDGHGVIADSTASRSLASTAVKVIPKRRITLSNSR